MLVETKTFSYDALHPMTKIGFGNLLFADRDTQSGMFNSILEGINGEKGRTELTSLFADVLDIAILSQME